MSDLDSLMHDLCGGPSTHLQDVDIFSPQPSKSPENAEKNNLLLTEKDKPSKYSEYGQQIKDIMKSQSNGNKRKWTQDDEVSGGWCDLQAPSTAQPQRRQSYSSESFIEPHSKIAVVSAQISLKDLLQKLAEKSVINISRITPSSVPNPKQGQNWVTFAVLARKLPPKESAKGRAFSVWYLTDLNDLDRLETLFLFGGAHDAHWKLPEKTVIGLLNPDVKEDREKGQTRFTLSIDHPLKLLVLGQSRDFAICQSNTKAGEKCTKIVNKSKNEFCIYHSMTLLKKGAKRPELAPYGSANFLNNAKRPRTEQSQLERQRVASSITASAFGPCLKPNKPPVIDSMPSANGNASVGTGLPSARLVRSLLPSSCPGVMNVDKLDEQAKKAGASASASQALSSSSSLPAEKIDTTFWGKQMLQSLEAKMNNTSSTARARRDRLAALIRSGQETAPEKVDPNRPNLGSCPKINPPAPSQAAKENESKKQEKKSPDVNKELEDAKKILEARSRHSDAVDKAFSARQDAYFKALEPRDKAEQELSETVKIKVKAIVCKSCLYVASSAADRCKKEHPSAVVGPIEAWRRFFACRECSFRTTTFSRFPPYPCSRCKSSRWRPAPVRELGKFNAEKLSIGVEELPHLLDGDDNDEISSGLDYGINA